MGKDVLKLIKEIPLIFFKSDLSYLSINKSERLILVQAAQNQIDVYKYNEAKVTFEKIEQYTNKLSIVKFYSNKNYNLVLYNDVN